MTFTIIDKLQLLSKDNQNKEWIAANGIGGYASGTLCFAPMRKYHSLLNAALPAPYGRTSMLDFVEDEIVLQSGKRYSLSQLYFQEKNNQILPFLTQFKFENGICVWRYEFEDCIIEKSLFLVYRQNTVCISYNVIQSSQAVYLHWRPFFHFRTNEQPINAKNPDESYTVHAKNFEYEIECPHFPLLRIYNDSSPNFILDPKEISNIFYDVEYKRGYEYLGHLKSPGYFAVSLENKITSFFASTESWHTLGALKPADAVRIEKYRKRNLLKMADVENKSPVIAKLVLAADQFLFTPTTRFEDMIRLQAAGEEVRSIIAGFPWFTDWGRDTMISLEGLTMCTGRSHEAFAILHTYAYYIKDGLIPNMFPDGEKQGIYNTADATLWFFHAINRYVELSKDEDIIEHLLPQLKEIIHMHMKGTSFNIKMDSDGLLHQGKEGVQLTWMDAKVGDYVVTPRRGKAVEINALWYNALKLYEKWSGSELQASALCYESFNEKFWNRSKNYLYDVVEGENGNDDALRPNQLFAISLSYPVLKQQFWKPVLDQVTKELLTPFGLRTLSPEHPEYRKYYEGDIHARDAAYHQGTVWPWLLGPYIDTWLKVYPNKIAEAHAMFKDLEAHIHNTPMGTIGEIFDAIDPYKERGCFAQAWSVAECLRSLMKIHHLMEERKKRKND